MDDFFSLVGLAICPGSDRDLFELRIDTNSKNIHAEITFDASRDALDLAILNSAGTVIVSGEFSGPSQKLADLPSAPAGTYYVEVFSSLDDENNYDITIDTSI